MELKIVNKNFRFSTINELDFILNKILSQFDITDYNSDMMNLKSLLCYVIRCDYTLSDNTCFTIFDVCQTGLEDTSIFNFKYLMTSNNLDVIELKNDTEKPFYSEFKFDIDTILMYLNKDK